MHYILYYLILIYESAQAIAILTSKNSSVFFNGDYIIILYFKLNDLISCFVNKFM